QSCFLKPDGSVFEGKAFVSIRYMQDVLDVAFRGLDLKVTKYPGSPLYNSDVMIEIEVSDGVFPLQFNNSMNIRMDVPTNDTASTFYYFDPESQGFLDYELYKSIFTNTDVSQIPIRYDEWLRN